MYKILVVDDEPYIREGLKKIIEGQNADFYVSGEAEDGTDALDIISINKPDIIITDIKMIEMDGPELIKRTNELYESTIKFIVLSAYGDFQYAQSTMKYGVCDYILKPIDSKELLDAIERITREKDRTAGIENEYQSGVRSIMRQEMKRFIMGGGHTYAYDKMLQFFELQEEAQYRCIIVELSKSVWENNDFISKVIAKFNGRETVCKCIIEENFFRYYLIIQENIEAVDASQIYLKFFECEFQKEIKIFFGNTIRGFSHMSESYNNAKKAYDLRFYSDDEPLVFYENIPKKQSNLEGDILLFLNALIEKVYEKNNDEINKISEELFGCIKTKFVHLDLIKININQFATNLSKRIYDFGGDLENIMPYEVALCHIDYSKTTVSEVKVKFEEYCHQCVEALEHLSGDKPDDIIYKIQRYLTDNYKADLKIKDVADVFYLNPVYLGQYFKKKTGVYMNDYINELRIKEAKQLLKNTKLKVYEIATMIGFVNSDYFTTKFEKMVGMTPIQYRKGASS